MSVLFGKQLELHEFGFKVWTWTSIFNHESQFRAHFANLNSASNAGNLILFSDSMFSEKFETEICYGHMTLTRVRNSLLNRYEMRPLEDVT